MLAVAQRVYDRPELPVSILAARLGVARAKFLPGKNSMLASRKVLASKQSKTWGSLELTYGPQRLPKGPQASHHMPATP